MAKKIKLTKKELNKAFPIELLSTCSEEFNSHFSQFELKALTKGVTAGEIKDLEKALKKEK